MLIALFSNIVTAQSLTNRRLVRVVKLSDGSYNVGAWVKDDGSGDIYIYTSASDKTLCSNVANISVTPLGFSADYYELWFNSDNTLNRALFVVNSNNGIYPPLASGLDSGQLSIIQTLLSDVLNRINPSLPNSYYVSASGSDSNDGRTTATPWQTLGKVTNTTFTAGENILFNRGDSFYGALSLKGASKSGTTISNITFNAYGSGDAPIITGFTNVTSWSNLNGNLWVSSAAISPLTSCNMVTINGTNFARGRTPNGNIQFDIDSSAANSITSSSITSATNYVGGEVVIFDTLWTVAKRNITNQTVNTIAYDGANVSVSSGIGFFIQNHTNCLNSANEWMLDDSNRKLYIYSVGNPSSSTIKAATVDNLFNLSNNDFISIKNLHFTGANQNAYSNSGGETNTIQSCIIDNNGYNGVNTAFGVGVSGLTISDCAFSNNNNCGMLMSAGNGSTGPRRSVIQRNIVYYTGMFPGHFNSGSIAGSAHGILANGERNIIDHNIVEYTGYNGITCFGTNTLVTCNFVNNPLQRMADGAGIYTWNSPGGGPIIGCTNMNIYSNIVVNCGPSTGQPATPYNLCVGIYMDNNTTGANMRYNSVAHTGRGFLGNYPHKSSLAFNNFYDAFNYGISIDMAGTLTMDNFNMFNNIVVCLNSNTQFCVRIDSPGSMPSTFTSDTNYYARPGALSGTLSTNMFLSNSVQMSLVKFRSQFNRDLNSTAAPPNSVATDADISFFYNATDTNQIYALPYTCVDMLTNVFTNPITLTPWTSKTLLKQ